VQNTGGSDVILRGMDTNRAEGETETTLSASLLLSGDAATRLENLVARLSIEPGIQGVHWRSADQEPLPASAAVGDDD
jgi:putative Mg2+ transporter-C (MgtC) family protein